MRQISVSFQWLFLFILVWIALTAINLPWIAVLTAFSWKAVGVSLLFMGALSGLGLLFLPQWGMLKILGGHTPHTLGLKNSYETAQRLAGSFSEKRPFLVTYPDPVPNIFVVRSFAGQGMILVSEGFVSILNESEICFVLSRAIQHLRSPEIFVQSGCILMLSFIQKRFSPRTKRFSPYEALRFLTIFPWTRTLRKIAEKTVTGRVSDPDAFQFVRGSSKILRAEQLYGQQAELPGLVYLGLQR